MMVTKEKAFCQVLMRSGYVAIKATTSICKEDIHTQVIVWQKSLKLSRTKPVAPRSIVLNIPLCLYN